MRNWLFLFFLLETRLVVGQLDSLSGVHRLEQKRSVFLIGDAGEKGGNRVLIGLRPQVKQAGSEGIVNFLGDNTYLRSLRLPGLAQPIRSGRPDSVQVQNHRYIELYRNHTDMSYLSPKGELGAPIKYMLNSELVANFFLLASRNSRLAVAITPRFTVRIRDGASSPVGTPSYRIGARAFYRMTSSTVHFKYLEGQFYHHSNGQSGDVFNSDGSYNTETGDFATNYLQGDYHWGTYHRNHFGTYYGLGARWHAPFFNHSEGLAGHYGFTRLQGHALYRRFRRSSSVVTALHKSSLTAEWIRIIVKASYAVNRLDNFGLASVRKRLNTELSVYYIPPFGRETGLFATVGYYGEDPYNIYFNNSYAFVRLGIAVGFTRYDEDVRK
jgi:hypothetical protein